MEPEYFKFVYASQQPLYVSLCRIEFVGEQMAPDDAAHRPWPSVFTYHCNYAALISASDLQGVTEHMLAVQQDVCHMGQGVLQSTSDFMSWSMFTLALGTAPEKPVAEDRDEPQPKRQRRKGIDDHKEAAIRDFPLLADLLDEKEGIAGKPRKRAEGSDGSESDEDSDSDEASDAEDGLDRLMKELDDNRMVCAAAMAEGVDEDPWFTVKPLGCLNTFERKGIWNDAIQGGARGKKAEDFCKRRNMQVHMRFEILLYGMAHCKILAQAFCHRQSFVREWELRQPLGEKAPWTADCWGDYRESPVFVELANSPGLRDCTKAAVAKVRRAGPGTR